MLFTTRLINDNIFNLNLKQLFGRSNIENEFELVFSGKRLSRGTVRRGIRSAIHAAMRARMTSYGDAMGVHQRMEGLSKTIYGI